MVEEFRGKYFGGHQKLNSLLTEFSKKQFGISTVNINVLLRLECERINVLLCYPFAPGRLASNQPVFSLEYRSISNIQSLPSERIGTLRYMLLPAPMAVMFRKKEFFLNLCFKDDIDMEQTLVFKMEKNDECYQAVYDKIAELRRSKKVAEGA